MIGRRVVPVAERQAAGIEVAELVQVRRKLLAVTRIAAGLEGLPDDVALDVAEGEEVGVRGRPGGCGRLVHDRDLGARVVAE